MENIHPIFSSIICTEEKEKLLCQKSFVVWLIGLSGSGKSTIAKSVEQELHAKGYLTKLLDGDNLRSGLNSNLGFSEEDRKENIRRAAEASKLFADTGIITICSLITPTHELQAMNKQIVGANRFMEVYINCPIEICEQRDVKGLYAKARKGEVKNFTGINSPFEPPLDPDVELRTDQMSVKDCTDMVMNKLLPKVEYKEKE